MIAYLARDIPPFVIILHCDYGESGSQLLIESTDSVRFNCYTTVHLDIQLIKQSFLCL